MPSKSIFYHQYVSKTETASNTPLLFRLLKRFEEHRYAAVIRSLPRPHGWKVLDIGCGAGDFLLQYSNYWQSATGIDILAELIREARKKATQKKKFTFMVHNAGTKRLPFPAGSFTLVTSTATLQYLDDLDLVFNEVYRVLKPGGLFVFEVPNFLVIWRRLQLLFGYFPQTSLFHNNWDGGVIHYFTYPTLKTFAQQHGFFVYEMKASGIFPSVRNLWPALLGANCIVVCQKK